MGSQTPLWGTLVRIPRPLSFMFPYSRRMMLVLIRPLHSFDSDSNILGIFVPFPTAVLIGFTHEAYIALEAGLAKFCFSVLCWSCFTHGNKALCFLVLSAGCFQGTFTQWGIWVPVENADVSWSWFPGRSSLIPIRRAWVLEILQRFQLDSLI